MEYQEVSIKINIKVYDYEEYESIIDKEGDIEDKIRELLPHNSEVSITIFEF